MMEIPSAAIANSIERGDILLSEFDGIKISLAAQVKSLLSV